MTEGIKSVIIFDFDGVIADTFEAALETVREHQPDVEVLADDYRDCFDGNLFEIKDTKNFCFVFPDFSERYLPRAIECKPYDGIGDVIHRLAESFPLALVSSTRSDILRAWLEKFGMLDCFKDILGADVATSKVEKFNMVLKTYRLAPKDLRFITDTLGDLREAKSMDIPSIAVTYGYQHRSRLEQGESFAVVDDPSGILEALNLYDSKC